jgi:hypothetical protein
MLLGPIAAILLGLGVAALTSRAGRAGVALAILAGVSILALAGHKTTVGARRLIDAGHVVPNAFRAMARRAAQGPGPLYLEALDAPLRAAHDAVMLYTAADEYSGQRLVVGAAPPEHEAYLVPPLQPALASDYTWVLTRAGSVHASRRVIARAGQFALEERTGPLDVAIASGVVLDVERRDPAGHAWVEGPLVFNVSARSGAPAWVQTSLAGTGAQATSIVGPDNARILARAPGMLTVCVPVPGVAPIRPVTLTLKFPQVAQRPATGAFQVDPVPGQTLALVAMFALARPC